MVVVFISWSGEKSKKIAEELRTWIPSVLQFAKPYFTPNDIEKGAKWVSDIAGKLSESSVGIICLTQENVSKPWILFEAGALSKGIDESRVCSVLFGLDTTDISGPLAIFQATAFDETDFKKMMWSINEQGGANKLDQQTFDRVFEMWWPQISEKVDAILAIEPSSSEDTLRPDRELIEEILEISRDILKTGFSTRAQRLPPMLVRDIVESLEAICEANSKVLSDDVNSALSPIIRAVDYLSRRVDDSGHDYSMRIERLRKFQEDFIPF